MTRYGVSLAVAVLVCALAFPVIMDLSAYLAAGWASALEVVVRALAPQPEAPKSDPGVAPLVSAPACDSLLSSLEHRDPVEEAKASIAHENFVLLGVHSVASEVPGVEGDPGCWEGEVGVLWIPDTSDEARCAEHARLQGVARSFAERYNRLVVEAYLRSANSECAARATS
ncbi:MAG TPA: hypothetical protein VMS55_05080 [Myxococcota bacterium]|nr:hypothetical protein [Myxococcota bacterium]